MLVAQSCPTLCDPRDSSPLGSSVHGILQARVLERVAISFSIQLKLMSVELVMLSNHLMLCLPLLLLPAIFPSIGFFQQVRWPKYWCFSFSISPSNGYSGLISFRLDLLVVQGTLKSHLQHHSSKASIIQHSAFLWSNAHICTQLLEKP